MDAIEQLHNALKGNTASPWVLDADISGCFDHIAHEPLLARMPVFREVIRRWLKAGVVELGHYHETAEGTPQGGVISPLLANIALDGMERLFGCERNGHYVSPLNRSHGNRGLSLVRYADDFVVTAPSRELLETYVRPKLEHFLAERGLNLNQAKTRIVHIDEGFNFLGFTIRRYDGKTLTRPQKEKVQAHLDVLKEKLRSHMGAPAWALVEHLNPVIRGWCNYYRFSAAKSTFSTMEHRLWGLLWRWCKRRHRGKTSGWLYRRYWDDPHSNKKWQFGEDRTRLLWPSQVKVERWTKVAGKNSPYDPALRQYWTTRQGRQLERQTEAVRKRIVLSRQQYRCAHCGVRFQTDQAIDLHHQMPISEGGLDTLENLRAMHAYCHHQWHARHNAEGCKA